MKLAPIDLIHVYLEGKKITLITHKETWRYEVWKHLNQSKTDSASNAETNDSPASLNDGRVGQGTASVPDQVTDTVDAVVGERKGEGGLEEDLGRERESTEGSNHGGGLEVPSEGGGCKVGSGPEVEGAGESAAGDTVQGTTDPGDLGLVDGQVGSDRATETLLNQDLLGVLGVGR